MTSAAAAVGGGRGGRERENPSLFPPCAPRGPSAAHTRAQARLPQAVTDPALTRGSARRGRRPRPAHWFSSMALRDRPCSAAPRLGACSAHGHRAARLGGRSQPLGEGMSALAVVCLSDRMGRGAGCITHGTSKISGHDLVSSLASRFGVFHCFSSTEQYPSPTDQTRSAPAAAVAHRRTRQG